MSEVKTVASRRSGIGFYVPARIRNDCTVRVPFAKRIGLKTLRTMLKQCWGLGTAKVPPKTFLPE